MRKQLDFEPDHLNEIERFTNKKVPNQCILK